MGWNGPAQQQKGELTMRQKPQPQAKTRPAYRVSFARKEGTDDKGDDILGSAREIGAIWNRQNGKGGILRFDHIPVELTQHQGVLFVTPVKDEANGGAR
jgi:hypothetical protein